MVVAAQPKASRNHVALEKLCAPHKAKPSQGAEVDRCNVGARKRFMYRWCHLKLMGYLPIYTCPPIRTCLKQCCACHLRTQSKKFHRKNKKTKTKQSVSTTLYNSSSTYLPLSAGHRPTATTCHMFGKP